MAAGPDLPSAVLGGLYELIERDAFTITWLTRRPVTRVDFSTVSGLPAVIRSHYARHGIEIHLWDLTTDIPVYVMMAMAVDRSGQGPAAVVGLGASLTPAVAATRALAEVCQARPGEAARYGQEAPAARPRAFEDVQDLLDHSALFAPRSMLTGV